MVFLFCDSTRGGVGAVREAARRIAELEVLLGFARETALAPSLLKLSKGTRVEGLEVRGPGRIILDRRR